MQIVHTPSEEEVIAKAKVLLEALPYIQQFKDSIFVVKYGGSFMDDPDPEVRNRVAEDIVFLAAVGIHVVVVHGGGKAISASMENRIIEYVDHLHEHFLDPVIIENGHYLPPSMPGYSIEMKPESLEQYEFPNGAIWQAELKAKK